MKILSVGSFMATGSDSDGGFEGLDQRIYGTDRSIQKERSKSMKHTFNLAKKIRAGDSKESSEKKDKAGKHGQKQRGSLEMGEAVDEDETFVRKSSIGCISNDTFGQSARNVTILLGNEQSATRIIFHDPDQNPRPG